MKTRLGVCLAVLCPCFLSSAAAQPRADAPPPPAPARTAADTMAATARLLELTPAQAQLWSELQQACAGKAAALDDEIREARRGLDAQLQAANPEAAMIGDLTLRIERARRARRADLATLQQKVRASLSPEQARIIERIVAIETRQDVFRMMGDLGLLPPPPPPPPPAPVSGMPVPPSPPAPPAPPAR